MVEQVVYSLVFILLNTSLYVFMLTKVSLKKKKKFLRLSIGFLAISFLIPFEPEYFYARHNGSLIIFSIGFPLLVFMSRLLPAVIDFFSFSGFKTPSVEKYFSMYSKIVPHVAALLLTIYQITTIWNPELFPPDFP
jgi:hypothetical protein